MKKNFLILVSILALALIGFIGYRTWLFHTPGTDDAMKDEVSYLNQTVDFKLLSYGEEIMFPDNLKYSRIESLDEKIIVQDADYVYVIINDLNGTTEFTKDDLNRLIKYADKYSNFNFYYLGTRKLDEIKESIKDCNLDDDDMSFGYVTYEGDRIQHYGLWSKNDAQYFTDDNQGLLGESICNSIYTMIKSNE